MTNKVNIDFYIYYLFRLMCTLVVHIVDFLLLSEFATQVRFLVWFSQTWPVKPLVICCLFFFLKQLPTPSLHQIEKVFF